MENFTTVLGQLFVTPPAGTQFTVAVGALSVPSTTTIDTQEEQGGVVTDLGLHPGAGACRLIQNMAISQLARFVHVTPVAGTSYIVVCTDNAGNSIPVLNGAGATVTGYDFQGSVFTLEVFVS